MDQQKNYKILLIDDDVQGAQITKTVFKEFSAKNLDPVWYKSGSDAVDFLETKKSPGISLVFLEIEISDPSGITILKRLKDNSTDYRTIPAIIFSRSNDESKINHCFSLGANSWVRKPLNTDKWPSTLNIVLNFWFIYVVLPPTVT